MDHYRLGGGSLEEYIGFGTLPMEQDADPPSQDVPPSLSSSSSTESKDSSSFVMAKAKLANANTSKKDNKVPAALVKSLSVGCPSKAASASAISSNSTRKSASKIVHSNPGTVTNEYGFRYTNPTQDPLVYIVLYKTEKCNRKPCARTCEKYHSVKERRRNPLAFDYSEQPCPNVKAGTSSRAWGDPSKCPDGDECEFSHTLLEQMYHPNIYKTGMCNKFSPDPVTNTCSWNALCTHAHGPQDRDRQNRALVKYRELIAQGITEWYIESTVVDVSPERPMLEMKPTFSDGNKSIGSVTNSLPAQSSGSSTPSLSKQNSLELHLRVDREEELNSAVSDNDPILRTPMDASPAYDATMNRHGPAAPFLSSFSNVNVPGLSGKPALDRPSSTERNPIGPKKASNNGSSVTPKVDVLGTSPLTQAMSLGSIPMMSPTTAKTHGQKPDKLERALSAGTTSIAKNVTLSGASPAASGLNVPLVHRPASVSTAVGHSFGERGSAGDLSIWGAFGSNFGRSSWEAPSSALASNLENEPKLNMQSSRNYSIGDEETLKRLERLAKRTTCPECNEEDRSVVIVPCRHFLCHRCADQSVRQKVCMQCNEECQSTLSVRL